MVYVCNTLWTCSQTLSEVWHYPQVLRLHEEHQSLLNCLQVQKLMDMGFGKAAVIQALQDAHGDENAALELILSRF